jgi:hypothetical protein
MCENPLGNGENEPGEDMKIFEVDRFGRTAEHHPEIPDEVQGLNPLKALRNSEEKEKMPDWLAELETSSLETPDQFRKTVDQFLNKRVAFYPGAGMDRQLFSLFGRSRSVHCFVHADSNASGDVPTNSVLAALQGNGHDRIMGYDPVIHKKIPPDWWLQFERPPECDWESKLNESLFVILKRQDGFTEDHGSKYLGFLHVSIDAYWLYWNLWGKREVAPYALLLQDHGYGGNHGHRKFGFPVEEKDTSPLYQMATQAELPKFLLVAENTRSWPGYERISDCSDEAGASKERRCLYRRSI